MARSGKWITGTAPEESLSEAARSILAARLEPVWYFLPLAAVKSHRDVEYVHQLRVSTRRAMAALDIFQQVLPPHRSEWMQKQLKRARQAAGDARDYDVLCGRLAGWVGNGDDRARAELLDRIRRLRDAAQEPIVDVYAKLKRKRFEHRVEKLIEKVRWRVADSGSIEPYFGDAARTHLNGVVQNFFAASEADLSDVTNLHQFRIAGKRLRYAMEVFAGAFRQEFRSELYPLIESVQEKLGEINDRATAIARLQAWKTEWTDPVLQALFTELLHSEQEAFQHCRCRFFAWWTPERACESRGRFSETLGTASSSSYS